MQKVRFFILSVAARLGRVPANVVKRLVAFSSDRVHQISGLYPGYSSTVFRPGAKCLSRDQRRSYGGNSCNAARLDEHARPRKGPRRIIDWSRQLRSNQSDECNAFEDVTCSEISTNCRAFADYLIHDVYTKSHNVPEPVFVHGGSPR